MCGAGLWSSAGRLDCGMGVIRSALLMWLLSAFLLNSLGMTQLLCSGDAGCWNNLPNIPRLRKGCGHLWQEGPSAASLRGLFRLILQSNLSPFCLHHPSIPRTSWTVAIGRCRSSHELLLLSVVNLFLTCMPELKCECILAY